jgi:mono/diheme cytochrome c family protein
MMKIVSVMACGLSLLTAVACGGSTPAPASAAGSSASDDQVAAGGKLYGDNCAKCHGAGGEGNAKAPPVVGKNALPLEPRAGAQVRKTPFHTAGDVLQFVKANMPPTKPGSLTDDEYAAIIAFDLKANGVDLGGKKIDSTTARTFILHP